MLVAAAATLMNSAASAHLIHLTRNLRWSDRIKSMPGGGVLGLGLLINAIATGAMTVRLAVGADATGTASVAAGGLVAASVVYLPFLVSLPGSPRSTVARLRHVFDGLSVGTCLLFASWLLVISPRGHIDESGFWVALLTCGTLSVALVIGVRATRTGLASPLCAGSVALSVAGLSGLAMALGDDDAVPGAVIFLAFLTVAPVLAWAGVRRISQASSADRGPDPATGGAAPVGVCARAEGTFAGYPVLALPAAIAIVVALHRLVTGGPFDQPAIVLGLVGVGAVTLRETLAAMDVSRYARQLVAQEAQFRSLVAGSTDVIMVLDSGLVVRWQSAAAARLFGLPDHQVVGRHFQSMLHPEDAVLVADLLADVCEGSAGGGDRPTLIEARLRDGSGRWRETESSVSDQREVPAVAGLVVHIRDVGERKDLERKVHRLAYADQLTGLANRRQMLLSIVALRAMPRARGALLLIRLDGLDAINDVRGYHVGDAVLVEVARRLRADCTETELPVHLAGDQFAVVTEASAVQAYALATRLLVRLTEPIAVADTSLTLTANIGMTDLASGVDSDEVLRRADLALHRARQLGRGRVEWFDQAVEQALVRRMTLEMDLPLALSRGDLDLMYQPILDLAAGRPAAVEALLRWRHPDLGTLLPAEVIPVVEDLGLSAKVGSWVLHQAGRQLARWCQEGREIAMAVNVSPGQLADAGLVSDVADVLGQHRLRPDRLVLELAEGGLGQDEGPVDDRLRQLRSLGVRTALDEFGVGSQSLNHLRRLPMDQVKLGRSFFVEPAGLAEPTQPLIEVMMSLGRRLGVDVIAHGLEQPGHLEVVRRSGCRFGQGHLFAHPQPAERTEAYLDSFPARAG
ncbi:MAG TPA: EAL domain-containing protein [Micromonosporaceae bacterium]